MKNSQATQPDNRPDTHEMLLEHLLTNGDKHAKISHELQANHTINSDKHNIMGNILAEHQVEKLNDIHETLKPAAKGMSLIQHFLDEIKGEPGQDSQVPGPKGQDGKTPIKGQDYLTPQELAQIKAETTPRKGQDYFTPSEVEAFKQEVTPVKGVHYRDGIDGRNGKNGRDGLDAEIDVDGIISQVLAKIPKPKIKDNTDIITKNIKDSLKYSDLKDAPQFRMAGTGYLREITDVEVLHEPTNGQTLVWDSTKKKWKAGSAVSSGGGYTVETPSGTLDGVNTTFTVTVVPVYLVVDNATLFQNFGYTISGSTLTLDVPPQNFIRSFHI